MGVGEIVYGVVNAILTIIINYLFFSAFAPKRIFKFRNLYLAAIITLYISVILILNTGKLSFVVIIILDFLLSFAFNTKLINRLLLCIAINLLHSFTELIVAVAGSQILNIAIPVLKTGFYFIAGMLMSKLLTFLIVSVIKMGKHKLPIRKLGMLWVCISILPITSFILIFIMIDYVYMIQSPIMKAITVAGFIMLVFSNILVFYVLDKICDYFEVKNKLDIANKMIDSQKNMYKSLYDKQSEIKKIKHDISNIMIGITELINSGNADKVKQYLSQNINKYEDKDFVSGNSIIDVLILTYKLNSIKK